MPTIITVKNLSKKYLLSHQGKQESYVALRDVAADGVKSLGRRLFRTINDRERGSREEFWALKDVSFDVKTGDRIGIIGRNGAGKSTLLKILSRITEPSTGSVRIKGRVSSLLEVGTGFHPELTGRENIFLNGAILGMRGGEIRKKFDEIVDFAEIERFLDTPVKRYSSGMYVRLAFAVAAHLEPEILVVDEVLAVGDLAFQSKCLHKMGEISSGGITVLFVSHNMQAVSNFCNKGILLDSGAISFLGDANEAVRRYISRSSESAVARVDLSGGKFRNVEFSSASSVVKWMDIRIENSEGDCVNTIMFGEAFDIVFNCIVLEECDNVRIGVAIGASNGGLIFTSHQFYNDLPDRLSRGRVEYRVRMQPNLLAPGVYDVGIAADGSAKIADYIVNNVLSFTVSEASFTPEMQWRTGVNSGCIYGPCSWDMVHEGREFK